MSAASAVQERTCKDCGHSPQEHNLGRLGCSNDWLTDGPGCMCKSAEASFPEMVEGAG